MSEIGRGGINEEDSDDGLWSDFETSAQAVAHLFRNSNWRNLQAAAGSTTQLYKNGLEFKKRAFEKGFISGRQALAKEIFGLCRYSSKINVEDLVTLLSRYTVLPEDFNLSPSRRQRNSSNSNSSNTVSVVEGSSAVNLFQQVFQYFKFFIYNFIIDFLQISYFIFNLNFYILFLKLILGTLSYRNINSSSVAGT